MPAVKKSLSNPKIREIFERISHNKYHMRISLLEERELLRYEAYAPNDPFGSLSYLSIGIDADGKPHSLDATASLRGRISLEEHAFYCYLVLWERDLYMKEPAKLEDIYRPYASKAADYLNSTPAERRKRRAIREDFLIFMHDSQNQSHPSTESVFDIKDYPSVLNAFFSLKPTSDGNSLRLSLTLSTETGTTLIVDSLPTLFDAVLKGKPYLIGDRSFKLSAKNFTPEFYQMIPFLTSSFYAPKDGGFFSPSPDIRLSSLLLEGNNIDEFFRYAAGQEISLDGTILYVSQTPSEALATVSENDVFLHPSLSKDRVMHAFWNGRFAYIRNDDIGVLERFRFPDANNARIYRYFALNPAASASDLNDLLRPYMTVSADDDESLEIRYFVDLADDASLAVRTDYLFMGSPKTEEQLKNNPRYLSKIRRFSSLLSKRYGMPVNGYVKEDHKVLSFLKADLSDLKKLAHIYLSDRIAQAKIRSVGPISIRIEKHINWLKASVSHPEFSTEELKMILDAYKTKRAFVLLKGNVIVLDDDGAAPLIQAKETLSLDDDLENDALPLSKVFSLNGDKQIADLCDYEKEVKSFIDEVLHYDRLPLDLPNGLDQILRPYQKQAVQWILALSKHGLGGVLADDMGLGKTLEVIAFYSLREEALPSLAIVPKSVLYNWEDEIRKFAPELEVIVISGDKKKRTSLISLMKKKKKRIFLVSYDSMRNDASLYADIKFDCLFADEAQFIKNSNALKSKAIRTLKSNFKLALTGTPIENSMADLWSIFDFVLPGYLRTFQIFKTAFILAGDQVEARSRLAKMISPFLLRRTKSQVLSELPPKVTERLRIPMDEGVRRLYDATVQDAKRKKEELKKHEVSDAKRIIFSILPSLTKLREICVDPSSFFEGFDDENGKLGAALDLIANAISNRHKVLVFSSFVRVLDHFSSLLLAKGITTDMIIGDTPAQERLRLAKEFNESDDKEVMLVSLKAGGTGLNLYGADIVIHLDPWWNLAAEEQAQDRAHRIGQTRPVTVYKLYSYDTIEERIFELQEWKRELYASVIDGAAQSFAGLTEDDLDFLLG